MRSSVTNLPWNDVNILVVTDVHSWIAGHGEHPEEHLNAGYGDVLSFYQRLQSRKDQHNYLRNSSLFFVMNGDFTDGTGLSTIPPQHLTPLLQEMPWDAVNVGNHELYFDATVQHLVESGFVDHWNCSYLSSNTILAETQVPLGHRFTFLHGSNNVTLLTFGFLYNFQGHCSSTIVERVEQVVEQQWFREVLKNPPEPYQAIIVLAHMDCVDPLVSVILDGIRRRVGSTVPVLFITGHSHRRAFSRLDDHSFSFEAGRFLDTIGWVSFSLSLSHQHPVFGSQNNPPTPFDYHFLDANKKTLHDAIGARSDAEFTTPAGRALAKRIHDTQRLLGLHEVLGCSSRTYPLEAGFDSSRQSPSLWGLYVNEIIPKQLLERVNAKDTDRILQTVFVQGTGAFRYSLLRGKVTRDDVIAVCPFNDKIYEFDYPVTGKELLNVLEKLETTFPASPKYPMPAFAVVPATVDTNATYRVLVPDFEYKRISPFIDGVTNRREQRSTTPEQICFADECLHTLDLWMKHVREEMPCLLRSDYESVGQEVVQSQTALLSATGDTNLSPAIFDVLSSAMHATFILMIATVLVRMAANSLRKQKDAGVDSAERDLVADETEQLVETAEFDSTYGSIRTTGVTSETYLFNFSQNTFNQSAKAVVNALLGPCGMADHGWHLRHWQIQESEGESLFLYHPPIEVRSPFGAADCSSQEEFELEEMDVVITDDSVVCDPSSYDEEQGVTQWSFSILYDDTYRMPVLYFYVQDRTGAPCGRRNVLQMLLHNPDQNQSEPIQDTWDFLSQELHPKTNIPCFFLHPCQSSARLKLLLRGSECSGEQDSSNANALWTWMSMILPTVGHSIPPNTFLSIQKQLNYY
ncbi:autophagocytosis associated protein, active-site domain containing protein [Nitzschia inconspicua]|uniref:Autophagocytosis associated protein, active-site domain containing protein n=1 Tax=Nitzschia inconspicua TaxID=303405 RepID=A0A9K3LBI1_9STRA|nr:autophagocytosis associated protein, active-site domain containing protein [Nitzschia inconspicua]